MPNLIADAAAYEAAIARDEARWTPIAMWNYAIIRNRMQEHR